MGLSEFPDYEESIKLRLSTAVETLCEEFDGVHERQTVYTVVDDSARQLSGGAVTPFIPVLAERFARERLQALSRVSGLRGDVPEVLFVGITGGGRAQIGAQL